MSQEALGVRTTYLKDDGLVGLAFEGNFADSVENVEESVFIAFALEREVNGFHVNLVMSIQS